MQARRRNVDELGGQEPKGRRRWREEHARAALEAEAKRGLSPSEFAEREGIRPGRLARWRKRLGFGPGREERVVGRGGGGVRDRGGGDAGALRLIPAVAVGGPPRVAAGTVVVRLAEGVVLEMGDVATVPPEWIAGLVESLRRTR
jgi:hypothetical protein